MFWGITLEYGKIYSQIVEMPFHISMAALGFSNLTETATTIMVESEKAEYAICTLQAGKIPQQPLDLNFTEGEEVKFFLKGNGGDVHLTGYLLETPREYEYEEDELDALMSSEEDTSVATEDEENEDDNDVSSENENKLRNNQDGRKKLVEVKGDSDNFKVVDDDESDSDSSDPGQAMLTGDLDDSDDSEVGDHDWKPKKVKGGKKENALKVKKKSKQKASLNKTSQKPISQTLINLMHMKDFDNSSESDSEWEPGALGSKSSKNTSNGLSEVSIDDSLQIDDSDEEDVNSLE